MLEAAFARHACGGSMSHADAPAAQLTRHAESRSSGEKSRAARVARIRGVEKDEGKEGSDGHGYKPET